MAELQHDRTPDQTATRSFAFDGRGSLAADAVVSVRLWFDGDNRPSSGLLSDALSPAVCLAIDTLVSSGGTAVPAHGNNLIVTFPDVSSGILAARRLQWAFEGLSEAVQFAGAAVAIVVHSSQDLPDNPTGDSISSPLEHALPRQILLSEKVSRSLDGLHVMAFEATSNPAFRALSWYQSERELSSAADEQILFRNIKEQGYKDAAPAAEIVIKAWGIPSGTEDGVVSEGRQPGNIPVADSLGMLRKSPRLIWGGSAFAILCAVGLIVFALHRTPVPTHSTIDSQTSQHEPAAEATTPPTTAAKPNNQPTAQGEPTVIAKPLTAKVSDAESARTRAKNPLNGPEKEPRSTGACSIPETQIPGVLERANDKLHAGRYDEAERGFKQVLGCEPKNARAEAGLEQIKVRRLAGK